MLDDRTYNLRTGLVAASFGTMLWHMLLSQGLCFAVGLGLIVNTTVGIVPQWFQRKRSFANSLAASGTGFGGLVYSLAANQVIQGLGLSWSFRILAVASFFVNAVCCVLLRDRNEALGTVLVAFHVRIFKRVNYLLLLAWGVFSIIGYVILVYSLPDYAQAVGFSASRGSVIGAMFNCTSSFLL